MSLPLVSLLIVVRNGKTHLRRCVDSLRRQDYPRELLEFVFVDGASEDGTYALLQEQVAELRQHGYAAQLLVNQKRILASGWNIAIREARGQFLCRIDVHSEIEPSYLSSGIQCLLLPGNEQVAGVGGWLKHVGATPMGRTIAALLSSKFAVGDSPFRRPPPALCQTDTAVYAVYRRNVFFHVGFFHEGLIRNQDIVLHQTIRAAGYTFLTHPGMRITYYVPSTAKGLLRRAFADGQWVALAGANYFRWRHKVPYLFVLHLGATLAILAVTRLWLDAPLQHPLRAAVLHPLRAAMLLPLAAYGVLALFFAFRAACAPLTRLQLVPLFCCFHLAYGLGTFWGYGQILARWFRSPQVEIEPSRIDYRE